MGGLCCSIVDRVDGGADASGWTVFQCAPRGAGSVLVAAEGSYPSIVRPTDAENSVSVPSRVADVRPER